MTFLSYLTTVYYDSSVSDNRLGMTVGSNGWVKSRSVDTEDAIQCVCVFIPKPDTDVIEVPSLNGEDM